VTAPLRARADFFSQPKSFEAFDMSSAGDKLPVISKGSTRGTTVRAMDDQDDALGWQTARGM
jgi:hypothetical protein